MAKFFGAIGYTEQVEETPGVWVNQITERKCTGDLLRNTRKLREGESLNDNISLGNSISIVADAYLMQHFFAIRYVKWGEGYWTVTTVEVQAPRLTLRMGEVYNGPKAPVA